MNLYTNIPEVLQKLQAIRDAVAAAGSSGEGGIQDAMLAALNSGRALIKRRIFNESTDAEGKPLGKYTGGKTNITDKRSRVKRYGFEEANKERKSVRKNLNKAAAEEKFTEYEKYRIGRGRQIEKKDLQMSGSLAASFETVKDGNGKVVLQISNAENAKIARAQERQIGNIRAGQPATKGTAQPAKIFVFSKAEFDAVDVQGKRLITEIIKAKMKA